MDEGNKKYGGGQPSEDELSQMRQYRDKEFSKIFHKINKFLRKKYCVEVGIGGRVYPLLTFEFGRMNPIFQESEKVKEIINTEKLKFENLTKNMENLEIKLDEYDNRFSKEEKLLLSEARIQPSIANKYDTRFKAEYIKILFCKRGVFSEKICQYDRRFQRPIDIMKLVSAWCPPTEANKYSTKFKAHEIATLFRNEVNAEQAETYHDNFNSYEIVALVKSGCPADQALKYLYTNLIQAGCPADQAIKHICGIDKNKIFEEITHRKPITDNPLTDLFQKIRVTEGIWFPYISGHPPNCNMDDGHIISVLYSLKLSPQEMAKFSNQKKKALLNLFRKLAYDTSLGPGEKWGDYSLIGTGAHAAVLFKDGNAFKFSFDIQKEIKLLKKLKNPQNVVKLKEKSQSGACNGIDSCIELEYIEGDSLENILNQNHSLLPDKILKYAFGMINGLIELRQVGIFYHRDIRPSNIIIDKEKDRPVIIDLGIATTNRKAGSKDNRRYGGANDLVSLGQVMYKMATGDHIFAKSKSMDRTIYAQKIKDYRDEIYSDNTGKLLKAYLKRVDRTIKDEQLKVLIKSCLTAKNYHYKKVQRLFKKLL